MRKFFNEKNIFLFSAFCFAYLFTGCGTTLYHQGIGDTEYRELEQEIRDGETGLAVTGERLEQSSEGIENTVNGLEQSGKRLEQSITESVQVEWGVADLLQQIRERKIPEGIGNDIRDFFFKPKSE